MTTLNTYAYRVGDVVQFTYTDDNQRDEVAGETGTVVGLRPGVVQVSTGLYTVDVRDVVNLDLLESAVVNCDSCGREDDDHAFWCGQPFVGLD